MKLMIASDIHGSFHYFKLLLKAVDRENPDKILLLGDILYHGPRNELPMEYNPKAVIEDINKLKDKIICVRGNCESEVDQMVLSFPCLCDSTQLFIDSRLFFATHGHIYNPQSPPKLSTGDIFLFGHTHIPYCNKENEILFINPGSVSIPKEESKHSYMIYEKAAFHWKELEGDVYKNYYL